MIHITSAGSPPTLVEPVRGRAAVVDRVARRELEHLSAQLERHDPRQDDEELLRVAVRVGLVPGRAAGVELAEDHLKVLERSWREHELPAERAERECRSCLAAEHSRSAIRAVRLEEIGHVDPERGGDPSQRGDARVGATALDLAQKALRQLGTVCDGLQRGAPEATDRAEPFADLHAGSV